MKRSTLRLRINEGDDDWDHYKVFNGEYRSFCSLKIALTLHDKLCNPAGCGIVTCQHQSQCSGLCIFQGLHNIKQLWILGLKDVLQPQQLSYVFY